METGTGSISWETLQLFFLSWLVIFLKFQFGLLKVKFRAGGFWHVYAEKPLRPPTNLKTLPPESQDKPVVMRVWLLIKGADIGGY